MVAIQGNAQSPKSSPRRLTGRYDMALRLCAGPLMFQSSPGRLTGRYPEGAVAEALEPPRVSWRLIGLS
ncbi:MAG: hypothetical protein ABI727_01830, partial [Nitrosospira sp.]